MNVIIMGCGRVGEQLSRMMADEGHRVVVIDQDPEALARLGPDFRGRVVRGVGFDRGVLLAAGIEQAEAFAATSASDNANIVAARIVRQVFGVPRVVARVHDPRRAEIYRRLGLVTISPSTWGARRIAELLSHADMAPLMTFGNGVVTLLSVEAPAHLAGHMVNQISVPGEIAVVVVIRDDRAILPTLGTEFAPGDVIHLAVLAASMDRLSELLGLGVGG
jgi:trk system potassium uptake protein TrkA